MALSSIAAPVESLMVRAYRIPTDYPEADGTLNWSATTIIVVKVNSGIKQGIGYSYTDLAAARLIEDRLAEIVIGQDAFSIAGIQEGMLRALRNIGRPGIGSMAVAAVDTALWDLKAKLLDLPLVTLLGQVRSELPVYGSGGFTSYPPDRLQSQLRRWVESGICKVKMKVGSCPGDDPMRVRLAREAIGAKAELFVDANGAYNRKQALALADAFAQYKVTWFEEPVTSDDLDGLRLIRNRCPADMVIAAGEYGFDTLYFRRMLEAGAVDVLQADATRCAGITGFLQCAVLCQAFSVPLSAHTAPALHLHPCCAVSIVNQGEYFHDHVRIERLLFDGAPIPVNGKLKPDLSRPGMGLELRESDAERYVL